MKRKPSRKALDKPSLEKLSQAVAQEIEPKVISQVSQQVSFSGPLPPPAFAEKYEEILPGFVDRSLLMAEKEQTLTHEAIKRNQWMEFLLQSIGLLANFILLVGLTALSFYFFSKGNNAGGIAAIITALLAGAATLMGKSSNDK